MLTEERHQRIIELLETSDIVKLNEFVKQTKASETTIRRDLQLLEDQGRLKRVHGGARIIRKVNTIDMTMQTKAELNQGSKKKVAQYVAAKVQQDEVIFIDAGTATYEVLPYLQGKNLRVVTNSIVHAAYLNQLEIPTIVLGGKLKANTSAIVGQECLQQMAKYHFSKALVGVNGIHHEQGLTTPDEEEALVKQFAIKHAEETFVLADYSKFETVNFVKFSDLANVLIITDKIPVKLEHLYQEKAHIVEVEK